jgi:L-histidine N-alpha-methyltransferase
LPQPVPATRRARPRGSYAERDRFRIETLIDPRADGALARDARRGLSAARKSIPPKWFYDDRGSKLFEAICELPEYYLTRTEQALLERVAEDVMEAARPSDLVELGSGASKKTRTLVDAAATLGLPLRYRPFDVCEPVVREAAAALLDEYPWLEVHAVVGDYDRHLDHLPEGRCRLVAFLGSTLGNYDAASAAEFVRRIAARLRPGEHLLLGADLVKDVAVLEAAYDDSAGVTAEFNRNVLLVLNRELGADFHPEEFEHVAFFDAERSQIEMHLRARGEQRVRLAALGMDVVIADGETIHTEISRKFSEAELDRLCRDAGFAVRSFHTDPDRWFALVLAERR